MEKMTNIARMKKGVTDHMLQLPYYHEVHYSVDIIFTERKSVLCLQQAFKSESILHFLKMCQS